MFILESFATIGRVLKYWSHVKHNRALGLSDYLIVRGALSADQLRLLEQVCEPEQGKTVESEVVDERFIFPLDWVVWSEIVSIKSVKHIIENFLPTPQPQHFMRNRIINTSTEIGSGGSWHRDSFQPQIKIFIPLSDVEAIDGALEYVPGTSSNWSKLLQALQGRRKKIEYAPAKKKVLSMKRGDLAVVNTSGLHRGGPPSKVGRDMVTVYMNEAFLKQ